VEAAATAVGERAAEILRAALEVGEQAQAEAEAMKVTAVENAQAEADRVMEEARQKIEELHKSIDRLAVRRANVLNELGRLQQYLAGAAPNGAADDAEAAADEDDEDDDHELTVSAMSAAPDPEAVFTNGDRPVSPSST
jgi:negative regulator of replication initiation